MEQSSEIMRLAWLDSINEIMALGKHLSNAEWEEPTPCPGWSRKDLISHIADLESRVLGSPGPESDHPDIDVDKPHVKSAFGAFTEIGVEYRRSRTGEVIFGEFIDITNLLNEFWKLDQRDLNEKILFGGMSEIELGQLYGRRVLDVWTHSQDLRVSLGKSATLSGPGAAYTMGIFHHSLPVVIAKRSGIANGQSIVLRVPNYVDLAFSMNGEGRVEQVKQLEQVTSVITMTEHQWYLYFAGREGREQDLPTIEGDQKLGQGFLAGLAMTP
jgi:uncharacterized protein (TIGR03083 family)